MPAHHDTYARFYQHPQPQSDGSFKDVVYAEIFIKGDKTTTFSRPMKDSDKTDYPKAWESYKQNSPELCDGNPISALPGIGPSQVLNLRAMGIFSVEDLAELGEPGLSNIQGGRTLQKRAKAWLEALNIEDEPDETPEPVNTEEMKKDPTVEPVRRKPGPKPGSKRA